MPAQAAQPTSFVAEAGRPSGHRVRALIGASLGTALIVMEANVVNVAVPVIRGELHADVAAGLWAVNAYTLVLAVLLLTAGRIADRVGARRTYLVGLAIFGFASVLCGLARQIDLLIAFRALQGAGAALVAPAPLALITHLYRDAAARTRAISAWVTIGGVGFAIGPLIGGALVDAAGWRSIFFLNVPIAIIIGYLVRRNSTETPLRRVPLDYRGQAFAILGLGDLVFGLVESSVTAWSSVDVLGPLLIAAAALWALVRDQRRGGRSGRAVLLDPAILAARPVLAGLLCGAIYNFCLYGALVVYSFEFQDVRHYSPLRTGLAFLPLTLTSIAATAWVGGKYVARRGARAGLRAGLASSALGLGVLAVGAQPVGYAALVPGFAMFALGLGLTAPAQTVAVMSFSGGGQRNMASSALNSARQTGGVTGVALLGALYATDHGAGLAGGLLLAAGGCVAALLLASRWVPPAPVADGAH